MHRATYPFASLALAGIALLAVAVFAPTVEAQTAPFTAYGSGLAKGDVVKAVVEGSVCGKSIADADGNWIIQITVDAPCQPAAGDQVVFWLNGAQTSKSETWQPGGAPSDVANGVALAGEGGVQQPKAGTFGWVLPDKGVGLVVFPGGTIEDAVSAAPQVVAFWVAVDGVFRGYVVGAPAFVNAAFVGKFPGGAIPAGTPMVVVVH